MSLTLYGAPLSVRPQGPPAPGRKGPRLPVGSDRPVRPAGLVPRDQSAGPHPGVTRRRPGPRRLQRDLPVPGRTLSRTAESPGRRPAGRAACAGWKNTPTMRSPPGHADDLPQPDTQAGDGPGLRGERRASRAGGKAASALRLPGKPSRRPGLLRRRATDPRRPGDRQPVGQPASRRRKPGRATLAGPRRAFRADARTPGDASAAAGERRTLDKLAAKAERVAQQSVRRRNISTRPSIPAWSSALKRPTLGLSRSSTATRRPS